MKARRNQFRTWCGECGEEIAAQAGFLDGKDDDGRWRVLCLDCWADADPEPEPTRWAGYGPGWASLPPGWLADPIIQMRLDQLRRAAAAPQCLRVLGLTPPVDRDAVQRRYRELAHAHHPDHGGDPARFVEVQAAYDEALGLVGVGG